MFTEIQLYQHFDRHQLPVDGRDYILTTRQQEASRMVGVHARTNSCSWFYSEKMQRTISTESRTAERAFVVLAERDENVFEIWDQPEPVPIIKYTKKNKERKDWYTPDFLVLRKDGPCVIEVKNEKSVANLISAQPKNWVRNDDGTVIYLPAKKYFESIGIKFEVWVSSNKNKFSVFNQEMALRTRQYKNDSFIDRLKLDVAFNESFSWSLFDLKERLQLENYSALIQELDQEKLFFDWESCLLSVPRGCYVVRDKRLLKYVDEFKGPKIYQEGMLSPISVGAMPSSKYAQEALDRLEKLEANERNRSTRRWKNLISKGSEGGLSEFQALIPKWFLAGNRKRKINIVAETFLTEYLLGEHALSQGLSDYRSYIKYRVGAQEAHPMYPPVAKTTFIRRLRSIPPEIIAMKRGGKRAANAVASPSDPIDRQLKAELAWQSAAIDHCLADIYLVFFDSGGEAHVLRPWITAMVDLATNCVLAFSISFLSPSRVSCAKVMRDCARRHGLLPKEIIIDRGAEFRSVYFSALLAHSKIELVLRPTAHSRYGAEVESLFGEFKKQWLSQRPGNLADFKESRSVDGKSSPKKRAVLTVYDFYREFEAFIAWRDANPRGIEILSPKFRLEKNMREYPFVAVTQKLNNEYLLATAVDTNTYKIDFQRGIHIGPIWYWSPDIKEVRGKKSSVEVRTDPENPHVVYALIDGKWIPCYSSKINRYSALDGISQLVEGLIVIDAFSERQKIKQAADEDAVRIIKKLYDDSSATGVSQIMEFELLDEQENEDEQCIFSMLKNAEITPLNTESWEIKNVWNN
ncbi:TnsA endonuclease N-terminal domain-containing protein [Cellvibrio sp. OA-2007]|uniref:TnsA endonuclease N-terminal domain-containing protein n=1 Tax=Cellvibrio sp. OA-2007 TaxID=529823 RepID=UPI000784E757|nr:TnsA endonuclease N-terminal domain-containing protein [Cellvibrio sp. OA-2007]